MRMQLALAMVALSCRLAVLGTSGLADWISISHDMADVRVEDGVLKGRVARRDPFFRVRLKEHFVGTIDHAERALPKPVRTGVYRVGATSFPGWTLHDWHAIRSRAAERFCNCVLRGDVIEYRHGKKDPPERR